VVALVAVAALGALTPSAAALGTTTGAPADPNALRSPARMDVAPPGRRLTGERVQAMAERVEKVVGERAATPRSYARVFLKGADRWQVSFYDRRRPPREIAQVIVDDRRARVVEAWTGHQVAWTMARGYSGAFGRKVNSPWVWVGLTIAFLAPFVDVRRPLRLLHLDLAVIAAFGASVALFNDARIDLSVPLVYPLLVYLLARLAWIGLRRGVQRPEPLRLLVPAAWLGLGLVFLVGFRIALNVLDSNVIDVGYAGVIGADRMADGSPLWGAFPADNEHGDTYGPVVYGAYVPFEQVLPWSGRWDDLPAAHGAAIAFDLACLALMALIGRRLGGARMAIVLAYAWAACPFTLYALNTNVNDGLVGALVLGAIATAGSPVGRGALLGLAAMAKFAPLALAPLLITQGGGRVRCVAALGVVLAAALGSVLAYGGLPAFYERTIGFQGSRGSPFSVWGQYGWGTAQTLAQAAAVVGAAAVAFVPRRRDLVGLSALVAAVLIAVQLGVTHWFYLYLVWFLGPMLVALLGRHGSSTCSIESARNEVEQRITTPLSQGSSSEVSKPIGMWVRMASIACSLRTPITPPRGPVIPTSVI